MQYLEQLMTKYGDEILRLCFLYLKDYQLAEDATQETFLKAIKAYEKFEHKSSEKTWLTRIAINCCKNIMRTHWFRDAKNRMAEENINRANNVVDDLIEKNHVADAIMKLKVKDRKLIILYYYQELTCKEIASVLGISENNVNQRLYRARQKLKEILKEEGLDDGL